MTTLLLGAILLAVAYTAVAATFGWRKRVELPPDTARALERMTDRVDQLERILRDDVARMRESTVAEARTQRDELRTILQAQNEATSAAMRELATSVSNAVERLRAQSTELLTVQFEGQNQRIDAATVAIAQFGEASEKQIALLVKQLADQSEQLRTLVGGQLEQLRRDNAEKLESMRKTVDEKLQGTLEQRLGQSFTLVSERLEQVHKSIGEMQALATGVGDLKRVLTNIKLRGVWSEVSLENLLEQMLSPEQYAKNVEIVPKSAQRVEFAIRLPGQNGEHIWLPIDAKFPIEDYDRLVKASESGDAAAVEKAAEGIETRIRDAAKEIATKYVSPPHSVDFGILFVPVEGLYAEVLRRPGLVDRLQRDHRVVVAGPTNLGAFLTTLRIGFRTLQIEKRTSEVWQILGAAKREFDKYGDVLDKVKQRLEQASNEIDNVAKRQRAIRKTLRNVESAPDGLEKEIGDELEAAADALSSN